MGTGGAGSCDGLLARLLWLGLNLTACNHTCCLNIAPSSPGSWTRFLAERMRWVIALDPGDLAPKVLAMPNVLHLPKKAEDFSVADDYATSKLPALDGNLGFGVSHRAGRVMCPTDCPGWQWHHNGTAFVLFGGNQPAYNASPFARIMRPGVVFLIVFSFLPPFCFGFLGGGGSSSRPKRRQRRRRRRW